MALVHASGSKTITVSLEDIKIPTKKAARKIYIPIRIQTNALNKDDIAINATYISIEDLPTSEPKAQKKTRDLEVRYLANIRSIRDKIKYSYSCNQDQCPVIKERLDQHFLEHHASSKSSRCCHKQNEAKLKSQSQEQPSAPRGNITRLAPTEPHTNKRSVSVSPRASILKRSIASKHIKDGEMQTTPKCCDFSHNRQENFDNSFLQPKSEPSHRKCSESAKTFSNMTPKISFATTSCVMKDDIRDAVITWMADIPLYPNQNPSVKDLRQNLTNKLIERIYLLTNEENSTEEYENKVKLEIDKILNALPMWFPGARRDQNLFREGLKDKFLKNIKYLRYKIINSKEDNSLIDDSVNTDESMYFYALPSIYSENEKIAKLMENEILDWVMQIKFKESEDIGRTINILDTTDIFAKRLMPVLNRRGNTRNYKLVLKGLIVDTLNDLPNVLLCPQNKCGYLNHMAEELANRLLYIQYKCYNSQGCCRFPKNAYRMSVCSSFDLRQSVLGGLNRLSNYQIYSRGNTIEDVIDILVDCIESVFSEGVTKKSEASEVLFDTETSETQASVSLTDAVVDNANNALIEAVVGLHSNTVSVYTSENELSNVSNYPVTSTPKKKASKKSITKQNSEEIDYTKKVSDLIRAWVDTLPKNFSDDKKFKESVIMDLAGDIVDENKLEQLVPTSEADRKKIMSYTIFRWLYRFEVFDELAEDNPQVAELLKHLETISVPNLTKPRQGNRQDLAKTKVNDSDRDLFMPAGIDILEDEISIWMNEQSSEIYLKNEKYNRTTNVHDLAEVLQDCLVNKKPEKDINKEISKWLKKITKSSQKKNLDKLSENLKNRIIKVPQDKTLKDNLHKKIQGKLQDKMTKLNGNQAAIPDTPQICKETDTDQTLKEFILKFMEHNYDIDDSIAKLAFAELLKTEFRKLSPPTRKEVYENFSKSKQNDFSMERFDKELDYIKIVSDWLRNIPIQRRFNTPHNAQRIEFVNNLAKNIYEVEEERRNSPMAMDYNVYLSSIIGQFTNQLPILPEHAQNIVFMIDELMGKIKANRTPMSCCSKAKNTSSSVNSSGIQEQSISNFIENYIHLNAREFADDPMKMDAWSARVLKEVKKIVQISTDPSSLCKTQVYSKLINVPIPTDESVRLFILELDYAREISDWMKNLPLLQNPQANEIRVKLIAELAEHISERERNKLVNIGATEGDAELDEYIKQWLQKIPLDPRKEIVVPIVVQQLLKRIERVNKGKQEDVVPLERMKSQSHNESKRNLSYNGSKSQSQNKLKKSVSHIESNKSQSHNKSKKNSNETKENKSRNKQDSCQRCSKSGNGAKSQNVVDVIEKWSENLPVQSDNKDEEKSQKEEVARKLYQKIGELSANPGVMNDNPLFKDLLTNEVDAQLNNLSQNPEIEKRKDTLKNELVEKVMEAKILAHEKAAGDNYKHQLENTIEASIPNPISNKQNYDPGFEIYKNRLADMFILENFDHGNDAVKLKYERRIRNEIDKYYQNAKNRNAVPLSKNVISNELYSALFKVPVPNETSTMREVEETKTRCEIDMWFDTLPIREAYTLTELLEWDEILSMLAKRLREIEQNEENPDEKLHNEIAKWVVKFPLHPGQENNVGKFTDDLQNRLKRSKEDRKCVTRNSKGKGKTTKNNQKKSSNTKNSVSKTSHQQVPSTDGQKKQIASPLQSNTCCQVSSAPRKKPAELIIELVEAWCEQLPFPVRTSQDINNNKIIRDNLLTKIIMKICELNSNSQTFNDELLYDYYLDAELERLMSNLPICCEFEKTKDAKKIHLMESIKSVMPLMKEERARYEYKQELKATIDAILPEPLNSTDEIAAMFSQLREEIVENFLLLNYHQGNDEAKQIYKEKLHESVLKYCEDVKDSPYVHSGDPLIKRNQLLCELAKVPAPSDQMLKDEVEEIGMKNEVQEFFDDLALPDESEDKMNFRNNVKLSLAKQLTDIERLGHNCENDMIMKKEINRCLNKLNIEVEPNKVDAFVHKLKTNEAIRKAPPVNNAAFENENSQFHPVPALRESQIKQPCSPNECGVGAGTSLGTIPIEYQGFGGNIPLSSSPVPELRQEHQSQIHQSLSNGGAQNVYSHEPFAPEARSQNEPPVTNHQPLQEHLRTGRNRRRRPASFENDGEELCKCGRMIRKLRGRPRCMLRLDDCEDYGHYGPMWMPMPYGIPPRRYFY